jgi:hypothetical protein
MKKIMFLICTLAFLLLTGCALFIHEGRADDRWSIDTKDNCRSAPAPKSDHEVSADRGPNGCVVNQVELPDHKGNGPDEQNNGK